MLESGMTVNRYTPWMQAGHALVWMQFHTAMVSFLLTFGT